MKASGSGRWVLTAIEARKRQYQVGDLLHQMKESNQRLQSRTEMLQKLSFELSRAEDRERKRIAQILHDDLQQMLAAAKLQTELHSDDISEDQQPRAQTIFEIISKAMRVTRDLSHELNPDTAIGTRLPKALKKLVARSKRS